ncbi:hypothetical protein D6851_04175 [Altericroceibacterium spongiae]|uniref:Membrane-associated oxidoreductase n=1 Tax=Altericroceibacterium spongiae TaxID=2320269 RepID=A0A420EP34_9SPHN|nr:hypothetical protein [Altericroceibacterium spongiae]RKF22433.1 hypothetical protein D6851_04175 [Altericroceibacterium spongiae]|tara:strand:- start:6509 stop:8929 length:2421 start_codon:yes stop_codon:yes gene_type:complete
MVGVRDVTSRAVKRYVRQALESGEIADCRHFPTEDRAVDADFLRSLILGGLPTGMRIVGLRIEGALDLRDCGSEAQPLPALRIEQCSFVAPTPAAGQGALSAVSLDLSRSHVASLSLHGSRFVSLCCRGMACRSEVDLTEVGPSDESGLCWIDMSNAVIGGNIVAVGAHLQSPRNDSIESGERSTCTGLVLQEAEIGGTLNLYRSKVIGGLSLYLARLKGDLWLGQCRLVAHNGWALNANDAEIGAIYATREPLFAKGCVALNGARIRSRINLENARISASETMAVSMRKAHIGESVSLENADMEGRLGLAGLRCQGDFSLLGARIVSNDRDALLARDAQILGSLHLSLHPRSKRRFSSKGRVILDGCHIGNDLNLCGADLHGEFEEIEELGNKQYHSALLAADLRVGGCIKLGDKSELTGGQRSLCSEGALRMQRVEVGKDIQLFNTKVVGIAPRKKVRDAETTDVSGSAPDNTGFDLSYSKVGGILIIGDNDLTGAVNLYYTNTDILWDTSNGYPNADLCKKDDVHLVGFSYRVLMLPDMGDVNDPANLRKTVNVRKAWLERSPYDAQDYATLARALRRSALTDEAREIMIARFVRELAMLARGVNDRKAMPSKTGSDDIMSQALWQRVAALALAVPNYLFAQLADIAKYVLMQVYRLTFGFGLDPRRATLTLLVFFVLGCSVFADANRKKLMIVDQQPVATLSDRSAIGAGLANKVADNVPCGDMIAPSLFALDVFIPLVDLRQESKCEIGLADGTKATASEAAFLKFFKAFYAFCGWIVISLSILTFSGFLQRRNELLGGDA